MKFYKLLLLVSFLALPVFAHDPPPTDSSSTTDGTPAR